MGIIVKILVIQVQQALSGIQSDSSAPLVTAGEDGAILRLGEIDLSIAADVTSGFFWSGENLMTDGDNSVISTCLITPNAKTKDISFHHGPAVLHLLVRQ